ncbi:hypothetical protein B7R21_18375 [Subtercola boreus]|uniref:Histidine kinase N-terminal 7TM region domain-containing protein n=1 Tax=Subtercola boreus TaxID=120213 RepID=A0A3E0VAI8_9MICO|nr:hypothetical protein [Subtercola boreus]RFA06814.1 hypothetical protein B7R21_18375 [Subtercola boreus]
MKQFAVVAFAILLVLLLARLSSLKRPSARPAWLATFFGCLAIISIGAVLPLPLVDEALGGSNLINLVQSFLTVSAFWFFRDAVSVFYLKPKLHSRWTLLLTVTAMAVPFAFIHDRGPTSNTFMADHVDQLGNVAYNIVYMAAVALIVFDLIHLLRRPADNIQKVFLVGLIPIPVACVVEIAYVSTAHFFPYWGGAQLLADAFYPLFYIGVSIVAVAWTTALIRERGVVDRVLWKLRSAQVAFLLKRSILSALRAFRSKKPDELAYALSIQIRNHEIHTQIPLSSRQERAVARLESRFLDLSAVDLTPTAP